MNIERLRKIMAYSEQNSEAIHLLVKRFCSISGIEYENDVLNILQIVRSSFLKKGYHVLELPFADDEIGALCYRGDGHRYVVVNTSLPRVNINFAIAHEIYHVFFQEDACDSKVKFVDAHYYEYEEEYAANLFAGILLMPEISFRRMYSKFKEESKGGELDTMIRLMAYYQVPYMSVLVRCCELGLPERRENFGELLSADRDLISARFEELWLDDSILHASGKDDYHRIEALVDNTGKEYVEEGFLKERTLEKILQNMRKLYSKVKGE